MKALICGLLMLLSSGILAYTPQNINAQGVSVPLDFISSGFSNQGLVGITDNVGSTVIAQSGTLNSANCQVGTQATLQLTKLVNDPNNQVSNAFGFNVRVLETPGNLNTVVLRDGETRATCVTEGTAVSISEETPQTGGFTFTSTSQGCTISSVIADQTYQCTITNTITGEGETAIAEAQSFTEEGQPTTEGVEGGVIGTAQSGTGATATQAGTPGRPIDPPFSRCEENIEPGSNDPQNIIRAASSMKIIINGKVDLEKIKDALNELHTDKFHVAVISDLRGEDGILSSVSNPQFTGKIIIQDPEGLKQKVIKYNILDVRRECSYITLAEAAGPATNANVAPLGRLGTERGNLMPAQIDKLLVGGGTSGAVTTAPGAKPLAYNPPFAVCNPDVVTDEASAAAAEANNLAIYNVRGDIDRNSKAFDENNLLMYWTVDLIQFDRDLAKIVDNNNPVMRVDLLTEEQKDTFDKIGFSLVDAWTDCKQIALDTQSVYKPFINELNY